MGVFGIVMLARSALIVEWRHNMIVLGLASVMVMIGFSLNQKRKGGVSVEAST